MSDIVQLYSDKLKTKKAYPKTLANETYMGNGNTVESQLGYFENKNIEQDAKLKEIENVNKRQDIYINGLFNKDGKLGNVGEGNDLKLEGSVDGEVEVSKVIGNTLVNVSKQKEKTPITRNFDDIVGNGGKLKLGEVANKKGHVRVDKIVGNTLVNLSSGNFIGNTPENNPIASEVYEYMLIEGRTYSLKLFNIPNKVTQIYMGNGSDTTVIPYQDYKSDMIIFNYKTTDDIYNCKLYLYTMDNKFTQEEINQIKYVILEGDYTNEPIPRDVIEGLKSSFEENLVTQEMVNEGLESEENLGKYKVEATVRGKNLFDKSQQFTVGYMDINTNGVFINDANYKTSDYIKVKPNTSYIREGISGNRSYAYYTQDKKFISGGNTSNILTPINCFYIRIVYKVDTDNLDVIQLEEGTVASDYEEYFERTTNVYLNSPFLKNDEIVMKNGELCHYHKYNQISKDFIMSNIVKGSTTSDGNFINYHIQNINALNDGSIIQGILCNHLVVAPGTVTTDCIYKLTSGKEIVIKISASIDNLSKFEDFITTNNTNIAYELAEPYYEVLDTEDLTLECANNSTIHVDSLVPVESISFKAYEEELSYLYTSKAYKVKFTSDAEGTCDITLGGTQLLAQNIKVGINEFSITTPETLTDNKLVIEGDGLNIEKVSVVDTNLDFDYFEGIYSCFENQLVTDSLDPNYGKYKVEYKVTGKNKFNIPNTTTTFTTSYGTIGNLQESVIMKNIDISNLNGNHYFSVGEATISDSVFSPKILLHNTLIHDDYKSHNGYYVYVTDNGGVERGTGILDLTNYKYATITTGNVILDTSKGTSYTLTINNIQLVEGTELKEFEPYKEYIKTFYLNSPLLKGDTIEENNGKLVHVHRYSSVVLDGSEDENWIFNKSYSNVSAFEIRSISNILPGGKSICNTLPLLEGSNDTEGLRSIGDSSKLLVHIKQGNLATQDSTEFKAWLKNNPITVIYQLATPIYETISDDKVILECANNSTLHIDTIVPVESVRASYSSKMPSLYVMQKTNDNQDDLINISLCATDEMYMMIEPLLEIIPQTINERMISKNSLGEFYLAMVQRNLKAVDEVPLSFREYVLEKLKNS